jgi:hypothetical protein
VKKIFIPHDMNVKLAIGGVKFAATMDVMLALARHSRSISLPRKPVTPVIISFMVDAW